VQSGAQLGHKETAHELRTSNKGNKNSGAQAPRRRHGHDSSPDESYAVIQKLAHEAIDELGTPASFPDLSELLKNKAARLHIPYNSRVVGAALMSVLHRRKRA
jgi:hypothetical protein